MGNLPPRMVVSDFSWAILIAVAQVFSRCIDLKHYLNTCFNMLNGPDNILSPYCYIRLDVSHFVKMISRWKCFKQDKSPVKKFYLRALCQAYKMRSLEELQIFFEAILTIALRGHAQSQLSKNRFFNFCIFFKYNILEIFCKNFKVIRIKLAEI